MATALRTPNMSPVESELDQHKTDLKEWISSIGQLSFPTNCKGVCDRFLRDCQQLITDLSANVEPSSADLCDFVDRKHSLEIQFHNHMDEYQSASE